MAIAGGHDNQWKPGALEVLEQVHRVSNVVQRVAVQDQEIGQLAHLDRAQIVFQSRHVGTVQGGHFQGFHGSQREGRAPQFPVRVQSGLFTVPA